MVKIDVTSETVVDRPVAVVAEYAADPSNAPAWYVSIESVVWETVPPLAWGRASGSLPDSSVAA